jgi:hypothetical protein
MQEALTQMNLQLTNVISDVAGKNKWVHPLAPAHDA